MSQKRRQRADDQPDIPIAPMIDCVFLLLVYFMVSSSLDREEWALPVALPASAEGLSMELPEEQVLVIGVDGSVRMNDAQYDEPDCGKLPQLTQALLRFRELCAAAGGEAMITLVPAETVPHQRIIQVLDALQRSGLERVYFGQDPSAADSAW
ncbi:MAG: biopolymer transporter ExbD [Opitutales bacterium]|nr:biopolymer transporter ExbD [Opitutales bacterium]